MFHHLGNDRCGRLLGAAALCLVLGSAGVAQGEDPVRGVLRFLFGRGEGGATVQGTVDLINDVPADFVNQYTPLLTQLMTTELHFANEVCELEPEQLRTLKDAGRKKVAELSKLFEHHQNQNRLGSDTPNPRKLITDVFQEQIDTLVPADVAKRYREEVAARQEFKDEAAREMMAMLIDRKLSFEPEQYDRALVALEDDWNPEWSVNLQMFLYDDFAPMPKRDVLQPLLTDRQRRIWDVQSGHRGRISFGWEQDAGLMTPWGDVGNLEVEIPADEASQPAEGSEEDR